MNVAIVLLMVVSSSIGRILLVSSLAQRALRPLPPSIA